MHDFTLQGFPIDSQNKTMSEWRESVVLNISSFEALLHCQKNTRAHKTLFLCWPNENVRPNCEPEGPC